MFAISILNGMLLLTACGGSGGKSEYEDGIDCLENKNYKEAESYFAKAVGENQEKAEYYIAYGMALAMNDKPEEALVQFEKSIVDKDNSIVRENNKNAYRGIGICHYRGGEYKEAVEAFDKALKISGGGEALNRDLHYYKADTCLRMGDYGEAVKVCDEFLKKEEDAILYGKRAEAEYRSGDTESASIDYDKAISMDGKNYDIYLGKYQMLMEAGDTESAGEILAKAENLEVKTDEDKYNMARVYYFSGDGEKAREGFLTAADAGYPFAYYYLGRMSEDTEDYASAAANYEKYFENPSQGQQGEAYLHLGICYVHLNEGKKALDAVEKGLEKKDATSMKGLLYYGTALYEKQGDFEKARTLAEQYCSLFPEEKRMKRELKFLKTRTDGNTTASSETKDSKTQEEEMEQSAEE